MPVRMKASRCTPRPSLTLCACHPSRGGRTRSISSTTPSCDLQHIVHARRRIERCSVNGATCDPSFQDRTNLTTSPGGQPPDAKEVIAPPVLAHIAARIMGRGTPAIDEARAGEHLAVIGHAVEKLPHSQCGRSAHCLGNTTSQTIAATNKPHQYAPRIANLEQTRNPTIAPSNAPTTVTLAAKT